MLFPCPLLTFHCTTIMMDAYTSKTDTEQTATKTQGYMSSSDLTVKEMKPSLSASIYTENTFQMYSVCDGHINWIKAAGE